MTMGFFDFLEKPPPPPVDAERAVEIIEGNTDVDAAVQAYRYLQDQIKLGDHTSDDTKLVKQAEKKVQEVLKSAGVILAFVQRPKSPEEKDISVALFVKSYLDTTPEKMNETPEHPSQENFNIVTVEDFVVLAQENPTVEALIKKDTGITTIQERLEEAGYIFGDNAQELIATYVRERKIAQEADTESS